jgi:uncharacterized protein (TIGR04255 family)
MVAQHKYKRPPITEAVLEFQLERAADRKIIESAGRRLASFYKTSETEMNYQFAFDMQGPPQAKVIENEWNGLKLSSEDRADVVALRKLGIATSRLAPYEGWEPFRDRARDNWEGWKKAGGLTQVKRVGLRYINRLDVPAVGAAISLEDYLNVYVHLPARPWGQISGFTLQVTRDLGEDSLKVTINSGSVVAPMVDTFSFLLDIDIYGDSDLPRREDDLWGLVEKMRIYKNEIFELCITDQSRALFGQ